MGVSNLLYSEAKAIIIISKEAAVTFARIGSYVVLCGLENVHVLSVFRHDYRVVLILS